MRRSRHAAGSVLVYLSILTTTAMTLGGFASGGGRSSAEDLVWHVETVEGAVVDSRLADRRVNPASVVKIATSVRALEVLGPEHRFVTELVTLAAAPVDGRLDGDLHVRGGADPDFHAENAFLMAQVLNRRGVRRVAGCLLVDGAFWMGWENGSGGRLDDPEARARLMAGRLRDALDPERWDGDLRRTWRRLAARRDLDPDRPPQVTVEGAGAAPAPAAARRLVGHASNPLFTTLRRFNAWSNNDLERLETAIGTPEAVAGWLGETIHAASKARAPAASPGSIIDRTGDPADGGYANVPRFETLSGLGVNRLDARQIVALVHLARQRLQALGHDLPDLLPVAGCGPGTLRHYPRLGKGELAGAVVAKTGTLSRTDGGVLVLAGVLYTATGEQLFAAALPAAGGRLGSGRRALESWVLQRVEAGGGPKPRECVSPPAHPDDDVIVD